MQPLPGTRRLESDPPEPSDLQPLLAPEPRPVPAVAPDEQPAATPQPSTPPAEPVPRHPTLLITNLAKRYGEATVFENVSLRVEPGEFVAIIGESGVGKSTLLNCMAGLDHWDAGSVLLAGADLATLNDTARALLRRAKVGFVFQAFHVLPHLDVAQNVALPLMLLSDAQADGAGQTNLMGLGAAAPTRLGPVSPAMPSANPLKRWAAVARETWGHRARTNWSQDPRVGAMLAAVGLEGLGGRLPQELSGGQLQRVAIARALIHRPGLLLADEPTGNLDPSTAAKVMDVLRAQAQEHGTSVVLVTHSQAAAARADRVLSLRADGVSERQDTDQPVANMA